MPHPTHLVSNPSVIRPTLYGEMGRLTTRAVEPHGIGWDHCDICHQLAQEFDLYDTEGRLPTWLSRVVSGTQADCDNDEL